MSPLWRRILIAGGLAIGVAIVALLAVIAFALVGDDNGGPGAEVARATATATASSAATATPRPSPGPTPPTPTPQPTPEPPQPTEEPPTPLVEQQPPPTQEEAPPPTPQPPAVTQAPPPPTEEPPTPPPPTPTPAGGGPQLGTYGGTTSQGKPFEFDVVVAEGSWVIGRIKIVVQGTLGTDTCEVELQKTNPTRGWIVPIVDNTFSIDSADYAISGTFDSTTTASGGLDYHGPGLRPGGPGFESPCNSGPLTWTASAP